MSIPVAAAVILGAMLLFVVVSMYLEQGGVLTQRLLLGDPADEAPVEPVRTENVARPDVAPTVPAGAAVPAVSSVPVAASSTTSSSTTSSGPDAETIPETIPETVPEHPAAAATHDAPVGQPAPADVLAPAAGLRWGALTTGASSISLRDADVVDTVSGILFAAYVAGGGAAAKRVSGWVSVRATPPSLDAEQFPAGADLRGKVGRVATILDCHDLDATWVVLQPRVDIARGLVRSPVTDPVLEGLLVWWRAAQSLPAVLSTSESADLAAAIAAVEDRLAEHPWSEAVAQLRTALLDGVVNEREVLLGVTGRGDVTTGRPTEGAGSDRSDQVSSGRGPATRPRAPRS